MSKTDNLIAVIIIISCLGIVSGYRYIRKPEKSGTQIKIWSADYQKNMDHLSSASFKEPPDFSQIKTGLFACHIPITGEKDFPRFTKELKKELRHASRSSLFHSIVVGGMNVRQIDKPLLEACKSYRKRESSNVEIVIVAPSTISDKTRSVLDLSGIKTRLINTQQTENPQEIVSE